MSKNKPNHEWMKGTVPRRRDVEPWSLQRQDLALKLWHTENLFGPPSTRERHYAKDLVIRNGKAIEVKGECDGQGCSMQDVQQAAGAGRDVVSRGGYGGQVEGDQRSGSSCKANTDQTGQVFDLLRHGAVEAKPRRRQKAEA